ncbi:MAG TPA: hypothetical protein VIG33_11020 [Pseudobdellovibrionaceae bacterium]|jgi:hypothetical protein
MYINSNMQNKYKLKSSLGFPNPLHNREGNIVLGILSGVIVIGVFLQTTGFGKMAQGNAFISGARIKESRDAIVYQIERYSSLPAIFRNSLATTDNSALQNCVLGNGSLPCYGDGTEYPVSLYAAFLSNTGAQRLTTAGPVSDNAYQPALYDTRGNLCQTGATSASLACPFEVFTTFTAKCPAAVGSPCPAAESISIHYVIRIPNNVFSGVKERTILATIDKFAPNIQTKDILPPAYGYVPNKFTLASLVSVQPGVTTTNPTYIQVRDIVQSKFIGTSQVSNIDNFTDNLFNNFKITDPSLVAAYSDFLLLNPQAAYSSLGAVSYMMAHQVGYTISAAEVNSISAATSWITDPLLATALGGAGINDLTLAQALVNSLAGITNPILLAALAQYHVTDPAKSQALAASFAAYPVNQDITRGVVSGAWQAGITDSATLKTYLSVIVAAEVTSLSVAFNIITQGVTDIATAAQMQANYVEPTSATTTQTTPTASPGSTPVPVALSPICDPTTTCASTPSSF